MKKKLEEAMRKIAELEARIVALEARPPVFFPQQLHDTHFHIGPNPKPFFPPPVYGPGFHPNPLWGPDFETYSGTAQPPPELPYTICGGSL